MEKVKIQVDKKIVEVPKDYTVLKAARENGIDIPTLCFLEEVNEYGGCRVCLVEVEGGRGPQAACVLPVYEGMKVKTNTKEIRELRKSIVELILANHNRDCLVCSRNGSCELQEIANELGITEVSFEQRKVEGRFDDLSNSIVRDSSKCILCGRCVAACKDVQEVGILDFANRGIETEVTPAFNKSMADTECIHCGQCVASCPVGALKEKEDIDRVWEALENPDLHVVVQTAPAVRAALGEIFGYKVGTRVTGKMVSSLRNLGFDKVFDTSFSADLTIMEEGYELLNRIKTGEGLPLITSCSPGWVRYCEFNYPELLENLSTCKSPQQMLGAIIKSYYAKEHNIDPKKIFVASIMPCTAKKEEAARPELGVNDLKDIDAVLTTRELGKMIKQAGINFDKLEDEEFDSPLGTNTGAGTIFGKTGGVMEAALRTVADVLENKDIKEIEYNDVRGIEGIREAELVLAGKTIRVAVAHGIGNARKLVNMMKSGEKEYHFIEIMGCSGGCVTGGGQPHISAKDDMEYDMRVERAKALYEEDSMNEIRKSHENPVIKKLYEDFLEEPNSHIAHKLLHTKYVSREKYGERKDIKPVSVTKVSKM